MTANRPRRQAVQTLDTVSKALRRSRSHLSSWRAVAREFGISTATAIRVAGGYEPKRADIRRALGLCEYAPAPVCRVHGVAHGKQCRPRPTFEQNAADYAAWLAANAGELARRVTWADGHTVTKGNQ